MRYENRAGAYSLIKLDHVTRFIYNSFLYTTERKRGIIPSLMELDALFRHDVALLTIASVPAEQPANASGHSQSP